MCDRDFVVEYMAWASLLMVHLSQLAEDMIILNTQVWSFWGVCVFFPEDLKL